MDFMIGWFPALKFLITVVLIAVAIFSYKKGWTKFAIGYMIALVLFWYFAPIKYDGTKTKTHNIKTQKMRTQEYKDVTYKAVIHKTVKPTFAERMAAENARSLEANLKVTNEIVK